MFFVIGPFCTPHSICINIDFRQVSFAQKCCNFNINTKKRCSSFSKRFFVFQKTYLKVKTLKTFKISSECHIKTCLTCKRRAILKIPSSVLQRNPSSFYWFSNKTSKTKKRSPLLRQKSLS